VAKFEWRGEMYEFIGQDKLNWVEMDLFEEKTGVTTGELSEDSRMQGRARVTAAFCWLSLKRQNPTVTWDEFMGSAVGDLVIHQDEEGDGQLPALAPSDPDDPLAGTGTDGSGSETSGGST